MRHNGKKIVIIDDDKDIAEVIGLLLEMEGYNPVVIYSGRDALENIRKAKPHLIILDVMLDGFNGRAICDELKADPEMKKVPVILVSAAAKNDMPGNHDLFIEKPFNIDHMMSSINGYLDVA
jgi:DNA-binding response OmpR family regulator